MHRPDFASAHIDYDKAAGYLLGAGHRELSPKARWFRSIGFEPARWEWLADALREQAGRAFLREASTPWGRKVAAAGLLDAPNGRRYKIVSVWMVESDLPRLVTAYPLRGASR